MFFNSYKDGNLKLPDEPTVIMPETKPEVGALKPWVIARNV